MVKKSDYLTVNKFEGTTVANFRVKAYYPSQFSWSLKITFHCFHQYEAEILQEPICSTSELNVYLGENNKKTVNNFKDHIFSCISKWSYKCVVIKMCWVVNNLLFLEDFFIKSSAKQTQKENKGKNQMSLINAIIRGNTTCP